MFKLAWVTAVASLILGCTEFSNTRSDSRSLSNRTYQAPVKAKAGDYAYAKLYVADALENEETQDTSSEEESSTDESNTEETTDSNEESETSTDENTDSEDSNESQEDATEEDTTEEDMQSARLDRMVEIVMDAADVDESGDLTLDEFKAFRIFERQLSDAALERIETMREEMFSKHAGSDDLLSEAELRVALVDARDRVKAFRERIRDMRDLDQLAGSIWDEILSKYDEDKDGILSLTERNKLRAESRSELRSIQSYLHDQCESESYSETSICRIYKLMSQLCEDEAAAGTESIACSLFFQAEEATVDNQDEVAVSCPWFDPNNPNYEGELEGGPVGYKLAIQDVLEDGYYEGDNFVFEFTFYHTYPSPDNAVNHGEVGLEPLGDRSWKTQYTAVIADANSGSCIARATADDTTRVSRNDAGGGCFAATTKIRMEDGSDKMLLFVQPGDRIWNPVAKQGQAVANIVIGPEQDKHMYLVGLGENVVSVTEDHPFLTAKGLKMTKDLTSSDKLLTESGKYAALTMLKKQPINNKQVVLNMTLATNSESAEAHAVLADGVVTGDLFLQQKLSGKTVRKSAFDILVYNQSH